MALHIIKLVVGCDTIDDLVHRRYTVHPRMTLDVEIHDGDRLVSEGWALNEVSVENRSRQGLLELVTEVDGRKTFVAAELFDPEGNLLAEANGLMVSLLPGQP